MLHYAYMSSQCDQHTATSFNNAPGTKHFTSESIISSDESSRLIIGATSRRLIILSIMAIAHMLLLAVNVMRIRGLLGCVIVMQQTNPAL